MPSEIKDGSLTSIHTGYPFEVFTPQAPSGKNMYDALFEKLINNNQFRLIFEYIIPLKRALALNTMYGAINFDSVFPDPCAFNKVFKPTRAMLINILSITTKDPSMAYEYQSATTPPVTDTGDPCAAPDGYTALANFLNREK